MLKKKLVSLMFSLFILSFVNPADYNFDIKALKNPREKDGTWVLDEGKYLSQTELIMLNHLIDNIEKTTTVEIAVVLVPNTGGDIFWAAQNIFDAWKIGKKDKDNGLLLLASIDERLFRTQVGYGLEGVFTDANCKLLQEKYVVPFFKKGKYGDGLIEYVKQINNILADNTLVDKMNQEAELNAQKEYEKAEKKQIFDGFIVLYLVGLFIFLLFMIATVNSWIKTAINMNKKYSRYSEIKNLQTKGMMHGTSIGRIIFLLIGSVFIMIVFLNGRFKDYHLLSGITLLIPSGGILLNIILSAIASGRKNLVISKWRNDPRNCPECGSVMKKLNEQEDDEYLNKFQRVEENILSNDYDVWICTKCSNKTIEEFRGIKYSLYVSCKKCGSVAGKFIRSKITEHPTYTHSGTKQLDYKCLACNNDFSTIITLPMLEHSSSYSSGDSSFGSSSGSGFGGGSSGGGGSTSSW